MVISNNYYFVLHLTMHRLNFLLTENKTLKCKFHYRGIFVTRLGSRFLDADIKGSFFAALIYCPCGISFNRNASVDSSE